MLFDRQVARLEHPLRPVAGEFILVRQTRMRGVDLERFDFDYDLTWMAFFLDPRGAVLGRYGGRDAGSAESRVSVAGLAHAMRNALRRHREGKVPAPVPSRPRTVEDFSMARHLAPRACVHCHQVYDLRRESLEEAGKWRPEEVWVYPLPENLGMTLEVDRGEFVQAVAPRTPAGRARLRPGDRLLEVNGRGVASFADVQYALHLAPAKGTIGIVWDRGGEHHRATLRLDPGWRKTDVSWRWSLRGLDPPPWVHGPDLSAAEKRALGLAPNRLALEQGPHVSEPARQAGIRQGDVIVGVDGTFPHMTAQQFGAFIRLERKVGDRVTYHLLRDGKRLDVTLTLRGRAPRR